MAAQLSFRTKSPVETQHRQFEWVVEDVAFGEGKPTGTKTRCGIPVGHLANLHWV
jgi:hypothetical protein